MKACAWFVVLRLLRCSENTLAFRRLNFSCINARAALGHHVRIAAGIFRPFSITFEHEDARGHPVQKVAVMTHQQNRSLIVAKHLLQEIKCFKIKIIGGLVQHQEI